MKDFMNVCVCVCVCARHRSHLDLTVRTRVCSRVVDVLQSRPAMLQRLRDGLHVEEFAGEGGRVCLAVRGQVSQEFGEVGGALSGAKCADGAAGWDGDGEVIMGGVQNVRVNWRLHEV